MQNHSSLSEPDHEKWHEFLEGMDRVITEVFGAGKAAVAVVAAYGDMLDDDKISPRCMVTGTVPLNHIPEVLAAGISEAVETVEAMVELTDEDGPDIAETKRALAEKQGIDPAQVHVYGIREGDDVLTEDSIQQFVSELERLPEEG